MSANRLLELFQQTPAALEPRDWWDLDHLLGRAAGRLLGPAAAERFEDSVGHRTVFEPLEATTGSCHAVYVVPDSNAFPLLAPAIVLSLRWKPDGPHDPHLPANLLELADTVRLQVPKAQSWSLHRAAPFEELNLSPFGPLLSHESAWAPLAGALWVASSGGRPNTRVWATGSWAANAGVVPVNGLEAKLALARRLGATDFFVPEQSHTPDLAGELKLGKLYGNSPVDKALRDYRLALDCPPTASDPIAERAAYYNRIPFDRPERREYYLDCLLAEVAARLRGIVTGRWPNWRPTHLVTIVSDSPELIVLLSRTLDVRRVLLLHTRDAKMTALAEEIRIRLVDRGQTAVLEPMDEDCLAESMGRAIRSFAAESAKPELLVMDATPGTKFMTLTLEQVARSKWPDAWMIYLKHQYENKKPVPLKEDPIRWQPGRSS